MAMLAEVGRLQEARDRLVKLRGRVETSPSPPEAAGPERDWVAREILAHIDEMLPYWLGEIERVLAGSPEPVPFGRTADDKIRTLTVDRDRTLPLGELYSRLTHRTERVVRRLLELDERQAARRGLHPRRGEMTVSQIVDAFLTGHLEEHCGQLAAAVGVSPAESA